MCSSSASANSFTDACSAYLPHIPPHPSRTKLFPKPYPLCYTAFHACKATSEMRLLMISPLRIYRPTYTTRWSRPLMSALGSAGFTPPAEDYIEGRIDFNRAPIKHPIEVGYEKWKPRTEG